MFLTYVTEKSSEHPLAKAIVKKIESLIPSKIDELSERYSVKEFKNRNGEGVFALINHRSNGQTLEVLCGNDKLANAYKVQYQDV